MTDLVPLPLCIYRGRQVIQRVAVPCTGAQAGKKGCVQWEVDNSGKVWVECDSPSKPLGSPVCTCRGCGSSCPGYAVARPDLITRIDPERLAPAPDGRRFNASIIDFNGRRLMAYRVGWFGAGIRIAELGLDLQPIANTTIHLPHPKCHGGREDPRLFTFEGKLHLQFAGLSYPSQGPLSVSVMIARLGDDLQPVKIWEPTYPRRTQIEKNWSPFEYEGNLYSVYSIAPHRVIQLHADGRATDAHEVPWNPPWSGGSLRGGAAPVRVGDEFYSWFHGWKRAKDREYYTYSVGCYVFEARPPFQPLRITPGPVWTPDPALCHQNVTSDKTVIYPAGVCRDRGRWLVSAGQHDTDCLIGEFDQAEIDRLMVRV